VWLYLHVNGKEAPAANDLKQKGRELEQQQEACSAQLFAQGQEFTYGLHEIGRYYADYVDLMAHWDAVLPGRVLRVQHEDALDDLEGQTRRMLPYIGLEFEEACLNFHTISHAVRTASSEQVRQPINRKGRDAWKPYEPWLGDLKEALATSAT
jgi:hypothetical protein